MKKTSTFLSMFLGIGLIANAQSTRLALYEEFTGENCPPCAATNPGLDAMLAQPANTVNAQCIKWQVAIPSAPSATWSLYQTNSTEINWRDNYYSISSAPSGIMDGQNVTVFGASSNHPANMNSTHIANAQAVTTPFTMTINSVWDATFSNAVVTITVASSSAFTPVGAFKLRLVLTEKEIDFATAPGTNGEKHFSNVVRKSYPDIQNGTALPAAWVASQVQTYTINCAAPSYIQNKAEMMFVAFLQDDGDKKVWQTTRTAPVQIPNDIKLNTIAIPSFSCANSLNPSIIVYNQGSTAITDMTITPTIDGVAQTPVNFTGNIASLATTTIALGTYTAAAGNHTINVNITGVSGGDPNTANNVKTVNSALVQTYFAAPLIQAFAATTFPPANWFVVNADKGPSWSRVAAGNNGAGSAKYDFYNNGVVGDKDEMYVLPSDLSTMPVPMLSFDVAYAQYANENDKLQVMASVDCGANWTTIFDKAGSVLKTVNAQTSAFTPASSAQWRNELVSLPAAAASNPSVLVKFVATAAYGNNMYIDNINISNSNVGIKTNNADVFNVQLYPNPSSDYTNLDITSKKAAKANVVVYNTIGQVVFEKEVSLNEGFNSININTQAFSAGVYNVVLSSEIGNSVKKLNVTK